MGKYLTMTAYFRVIVFAFFGLFYTFVKFRVILKAPTAKLHNMTYIKMHGLLKLEPGSTIQGKSKQGIHLGKRVSFGEFCQLRPSSYYFGDLGEGCKIDDETTFGPFCYIGCAGFIKIGKRNQFGPRVTLIAESHVVPENMGRIKGAGTTRVGIVIGSDCWFGANSVILDGVNIGDGCIIAAGAVVNKSIPDGAVVAGVPARVIKVRA